jgi:hypothetical protein
VATQRLPNGSTLDKIDAPFALNSATAASTAALCEPVIIKVSPIFVVFTSAMTAP